MAKHYVADMIEKMLEDRKYFYRETETYSWYRRVSRIPIQYFREQEIYFEDLNTMVLTDFFARNRYKSDGSYYSQKYIAAWRSIITSLIKYMDVRYDIIIRDPFRNFSMPWVPPYNPRDRAIPRDVLTILLSALRDNYRYQIITILLLHTGMRIGELCALQKDDIEYGKQTIHIRHSLSPRVEIRADGSVKYHSYYLSDPKTMTSKRDLPMDDITREALIGWDRFLRSDDKLLEKIDENKTEKFVFVNFKGRIMNPASLREGYRKYLKERGLAQYEICFHKYRHTYATQMQTAGVDINVIKELLGHSSITTTAQIYIKSDMEAMRHAQNLYSNFMDNIDGKIIL